MDVGRIRRLDIAMRDSVENAQRFGQGMGELLSRESDDTPG
jgi:hypothetical protein